MNCATTLECPVCKYDNIVVTCGFCLQCGTDLEPIETSTSSSDIGDKSDVADDRPEASIENHLQTIAKELGSELRSSRYGWQIVVPLAGDRKQTVQVWWRQAAPQSLGFMSLCGPAGSQHAMRLLQWNSHLKYCAFAVRMIGDRPMFVVSSTCPAEPLNPAHWCEIIRAVADRADQVEAKLSQGADRF